MVGNIDESIGIAWSEGLSIRQILAKKAEVPCWIGRMFHALWRPVDWRWWRAVNSRELRQKYHHLYRGGW